MTSAAFAGAVDLSGLASRPAQPDPSDVAAPAAPSDSAADSSGPDGSAVFEVTDETFVAEVIERSKQVPVVIDFWATWCGPCKQLSPLLERLAREADGAWVLAEMDVDANQGVSGQLQVQSIPTVMAAIGGQLMQGFSGALPEDQVRQFIDAVLQASAQAGIGEGPPEPQLDPKLTEAEEALQRGDLNAAEAAFVDLLNRTPGDPVAKSGVAMVKLLGRVQAIDPALALANAQALPDDVTAQLVASDIELTQGQVEPALQRLVSAVRRFRGAERDKVRDHFVELVEMLQPDDPVVLKARRDLANALF